MKAANNLMVRIGEGLIGWFSFQQAAHRSGIYSEYLFYPPIFEIASGRKWSVKSQIPLAENKRSTYDMSFLKSDKVAAAAIEIKFVRRNPKSYRNAIIHDLNKLHLIKTNPENHPRSVAPQVYELIIGKERLIKSAVRGTPLAAQWDGQWVEGRPRKLGSNTGWRLRGGGQESFAYSVAIFRYEAAWGAGFDPDNLEDDKLEPIGEVESLMANDDED